jgi:hypothetical protein
MPSFIAITKVWCNEMLRVKRIENLIS